jgi:hypothetical protein
MAVLSIYESWPDPSTPEVRHFSLITDASNHTEDDIKKSTFLPRFGHKHPTLQGKIATTFAAQPSPTESRVWTATVTYEAPPPHAAPGAKPVFAPVIPKSRRRGPLPGQKTLPPKTPPAATT